MSDTCDFIDQMASPVLSSLPALPIECKHELNDEQSGADSEAISIHCDLGISRSPTIMIAYLMRKLNMQQADVLNFVQTKQKVKPSSNRTRQLQVWEDVEFHLWENEERTIPKPAYKAFLEHVAALLRQKGLTGNEPLAPQSL
jgi:dual specificity phosphatase 12